ncbi:MAG: poly [ADP-ribose] polymerase [Paraglaciecola sp.]
MGSRSATATYPMAQWDKKFREKTRKSYKDQTHLFATRTSVAEFATIDNALIRDLMDDLLRFARQSIFTNYNASSEEVTQKQVEQAQHKLNLLVSKVVLKVDAAAFNRDLIELYSIIPRKIRQVKDHLIEAPQNTSDLEIIENKLAKEQATLDVMRGQVEQTDSSEETTPQTLLDAFGLQIQSVENAKLIKNIKKMMGDDADKFKQAYHVVNLRSQQHFNHRVNDSTNPKTELFWHRSRNENWSSGNHNRGFLALYDVHVGKQCKIRNHQSWCSNLSTENLKKNKTKMPTRFSPKAV